ncbi:hypothetical protein ACQPZX_35045 [Actinoplanes sp. CA-142083]|uniref:hypothetical protein n=1 Tax=Actinoplanes sp. CA-142083 TaxID=3239903 RepID=UPI003D8B7457
MSDAFVKWCRRGTTDRQFLERAEKFAAAGISLTHPGRRVAVLLDVDGNDVAMSPEEVASLVGRRVGRSLTLEWWFTPDVDLTCTYTFVPGAREVQTYYLDGLSPAEVTVVRELLVNLFFEDVTASQWLVADTTGLSADFDWDDYLLYGAGSPSTSPDLVLVNSATSSVPVDLPSASRRRDLDGGVVEFAK